MSHANPEPVPMPSLSGVARRAERIVVLTGAGFSAPSGLPVYRNGGAGWADAEGERMSHASRYGNHLETLWLRWHALAKAAQEAEPNIAHAALARWERRLGAQGRLTVVTQNVDGLHQRAGSSEVLEVHGTILRARRLNGQHLFDFDPVHGGQPPMSPDGSQRTRPDVVLFGERPRHMKQAMAAAREADLLLVAGTSGNVRPASDLPAAARANGVHTVLLNQEPWGQFDETLLHDVEVLADLI